ncbi:MAG: hypothetical protein H7Y13_10285 [Sphingobacteriaceae bacterium]|nr:hypothetical protein [Sphingobacteriaceae bacterium]
MIDQKTRTMIRPMRRAGITESKKAELDALNIQVLDAQHDVDQNQAIVTSLTEKLNNFQGYLAIADTKRTEALNNKNLVDQLVRSALDLRDNSEIAFNEVVKADNKTKELAIQIGDVMNKLIYSAEVINKLANSVIRKKALNPLISDELISVLTTAGTDANNAVALTLVALQSTYAAQATTIESEQAMALEFIQSMNLYQTLTGTKPQENQALPSNAVTEKRNTIVPLQKLLHYAYKEAKSNYEAADYALNVTTVQLNNAQGTLSKSQVSLKSLQSGLAAANAAALAS